MSGGKYSECILVYSALDIVFSKEKSFRLQDINLAHHRASGIVILKVNFYSKRDDIGDDTSSGYSILYPTTVILTLYGSDFIGRY